VTSRLHQEASQFIAVRKRQQVLARQSRKGQVREASVGSEPKLTLATCAGLSMVDDFVSVANNVVGVQVKTPTEECENGGGDDD
jgi:hypothetical protein